MFRYFRPTGNDDARSIKANKRSNLLYWEEAQPHCVIARRHEEAIYVKNQKDIDSECKQIKVEQGKGKKDRYTLLSIKTI